MSSRWWTVSNAFEKSIAMMIVQRGGRGWLKPEAMVWLRGRRADVVEWSGRKLCRESDKGMAAVRCGRIRRSNTLTAGQRNEMGRYDGLEDGGLPGLGREMIIADFQIEGMLDEAMERLKR